VHEATDIGGEAAADLRQQLHVFNVFAAGDVVGVFVDIAIDEADAVDAITGFLGGDAGVAVEIPIAFHRILVALLAGLAILRVLK
jgi:hypothetical protein